MKDIGIVALKSLALAVLAALAFTGCGPSSRDRALQRQAIWSEFPGAPIESKGEDVYFVTAPNGEVLQMVMMNNQIIGVVCAKKCKRPKAPTGQQSHESQQSSENTY